MAQHRMLAYDNWIASTTLDWDWHYERSAPAQSLAKLVCPLRIPSFPPETHNYNPKRHNPMEGVNMISRPEAQAKFREYRETLGSLDEVFADGSKMNESGGSGSHQLPFPEWWDYLPPLDQKITRQQHHLCCWSYSHHSGTELLPTHGPSPLRCNSLLWLNVLLAGDWGWRHWEPFYLPYHEPPLVVEWQRHTYSFLLDTKPLWHRRKWKSWPAGKGDPWPWHRSSGGCPLCRFETTGQLLHTAGGSNQVRYSCTWQRSLFRETSTGATEAILSLNQSCNHPTTNWPYKGHQVPCLVLRTADCLSPLWSNTDHWPYAPGVCSVTGMLWWILHSWLIECPLRDNSRDLHSGIPARSGILLSVLTQFVNFK